MQKRYAGSRFGTAAVAGVMLSIALLGFTGCEDDPDLSGENKITAFKIGGVAGAIAEVDQQISLTVPATTNLAQVTPEITVSSKASVSPSSEEAVNVTAPVSYTVTAENGVTRTYTVTVLKEGVSPTLDLIQIRALPTKTVYAIGETFSPVGLVVIGSYSDNNVREVVDYTLSDVTTTTAGSKEVTVTFDGKTVTFEVTVQGPQFTSVKVTPLKRTYPYGTEEADLEIRVEKVYADGSTETVTADYEVSGYEPERSGSQTVFVTLSGKTDTFEVELGPKPENRSIPITVGLPNTNQEPEIFGIPAGGIKLSMGQNPDLPSYIVISVAGKTSGDSQNQGVYSEVAWYVDGTESFEEDNNIIILLASEYTLKIPHSLTFVGTKGGVEYSRTIQFTVEQ